MRSNDRNNIELTSNPVREIRAAEENEGRKKEKIEYDDLLTAAGGFGRYQLVLFISTFPFYIFGGFGYFSQIFITQVSPNHWCWIPELENLTNIERRNLAIPPADHGVMEYSRCSAYDADWAAVLSTGIRPNKTTPIIPCKHGWEFNKSEIPYDTISSDMGWVCDKDNYVPTAQSMFFVGSVFGGILIGWISDRYGRLPALVLSNLIGCAGGVASAFATNFFQFTLCRFIFGMSNDNLTIMAYLIVLEYVSPKYRAFVANLPFALFYAPLLVAFPWLALACGHWKTIALATSAPIGLALFSPLFIPESPRWLLSKGKIDKVIQKLENIAKTNKQDILPEHKEKFRASLSLGVKEESVSMIDLLRRPLLRRTYICMCLVYMSAVLVFDALVRTIEHVKFDFFISFSLVSLTELPSLVISAFILDWVGRKRMIAITMSICCVSSILIAFVGGGIPSLVCAVIARFVVNVGFGTSTQWTSELLPTPVRGIGTSITHILGFVVIILSPYIAYLEKYIHWFPMVLIGCIAAFCAILAQTLPETSGQVLPQTFEDGEKLVRSQRMFGGCCGKTKTEEYAGQENKGFDQS